MVWVDLVDGGAAAGGWNDYKRNRFGVENYYASLEGNMLLKSEHVIHIFETICNSDTNFTNI